MSYQKVIRKSLTFNVKEKLKELLQKKDRDELPYIGSQIYYGFQGKGKTLSMVRHAYKIHKKYPKAIIVSNLHLNRDQFKDYIYFETFEELQQLFRTLENGKYGVIYLIDEIHNYFHSHDSRSIPLWIVQVFSQQRKRRVLVIGTVQMWKDVTKAIRDQIENLIYCNKFAGIVINQVLDPRLIEKQYGEEKIKVKKFGFYVPTYSLYNLYDTTQVINSGRSIFGSIEPVTISMPKK